jgi:hypothetical protein
MPPTRLCRDSQLVEITVIMVTGPLRCVCREQYATGESALELCSRGLIASKKHDPRGEIIKPWRTEIVRLAARSTEVTATPLHSLHTADALSTDKYG